MRKATKQQVRWVQGHYTDPKPVPTAYEIEVKRLGLQNKSIETLIASDALRKWTVKHRNTSFIPEILLHKWEMITEWATESKRGLPRLSMEDVRLVMASPSSCEI